jgi:hypothetical protein
MKPMRIVFFGTPDFAAHSLEKVIQAGYEVVVVVTAPDKPAGRGMKIQSSAVKQTADAHGIPVLQPTNLKDAAFQETLKAYNLDLGIVIAFFVGCVIAYFMGMAIVAIPSVNRKLYGKMAKHVINMQKWGGFLIAVGALLPLPFAIACLAAGMINYSRKHFFLFGLLRFFRFAIYGFVIYAALS